MTIGEHKVIKCDLCEHGQSNNYVTNSEHGQK